MNQLFEKVKFTKLRNILNNFTNNFCKFYLMTTCYPHISSLTGVNASPTSIVSSQFIYADGMQTKFWSNSDLPEFWDLFLRSGQLLPGHHKVMWLNLMIPASQGKVLDTHLLTSKFFHPAADQKYVFFWGWLNYFNSWNTWHCFRWISIKQLKLAQL